MIGICCPVKLLLMAADTGHGCPGIHSIRMTGGAGSGHVGTGQRKACGAVAETGRLPRAGRMTERAVERERWLRVFRGNDCIVVSLMAAGALQRSALIAAVRVALVACHCRVCAGQWEVCIAMIEIRIPIRCTMTSPAISWITSIVPIIKII